MGATSQDDKEEMKSVTKALVKPGKVKMRKVNRCAGLKAFQVMFQHPNMGKAVVAAGLQMAGASVANMLAIQPLQAMYWQNNMAQYSTIFATAQTLVAIIGSGPFGRMSDKFDRRISAVLFGAATFLPSWALLVFGLTENGLFLSSVAQVISGFVISTNAMLVLTNDVTPEEIRGLGFGLYYSICNAMQFGLQAIPSLMRLDCITVLYYQVAISALFFALVVTIKPEMNTPDEDEEDEEDTKVATDEEKAGEPKLTLKDKHRWNPLMAVLRPMLLAWNNPELRGLCVVAGIISVTSGLVFMNSAQYYRSELDLFPYGTAEQQQMVSFISCMPGEILVIPGYMIMGILDTKFGSLQMLRWYIPARSLMVLCGCGLHFAPDLMSKWCLVPITDVLTCYGALVYLPLNRLIADFSKGRVGEAMGALGQVQQIAGQFTNIPIALGLTSYLMRCGLDKPEWLYYLFAALFSLLAMIPAFRMNPPGYMEEEKTRAEEMVDVLFKTLGVKEAGRLSYKDLLKVVTEYTHADESKIAKVDHGYFDFCKQKGLNAGSGLDRAQVKELAETMKWTFNDEKLTELHEAAFTVEQRMHTKFLAEKSTIVKLERRAETQKLMSLSRAYSMELSSRTAHTLDARPLYMPRAMTGHDALEICIQHPGASDDEDDEDEEHQDSSDSDGSAPGWFSRFFRGRTRE